MEALWIALLVLAGIAAFVLVVAVAVGAGVFIFAVLPLVIGIPLGIWVNQYSTPLGVAIILISVVAEIVWASIISAKWD